MVVDCNSCINLIGKDVSDKTGNVAILQTCF